MKERVKFVLEWEKRWDEDEGQLNFAELCRELGISRTVGYDWVRRYQDAKHDVKAIQERSRRPHRSPAKVSDEVEEFLVAARKARPTWGPKKLRAFLSEHRPKLAELPAPSTIGEVGIRLERIEPGKPQQNGRQERFHRTLKCGDRSAASREHACV